MIDLRDMSPDDKRLYWSGCVVFNKDTNEAYIVSEYTGSWHLRPVGGSCTDVVRVSNKKFAECYIKHRAVLGWRNVKNFCMYSEAMPGRNNRKGITPQEISVASPMYDTVKQYYMEKRDQIHYIMDRGDDEEYENYIKYLDKVTSRVTAMSFLSPADRTSAYLNNYSNPFIARDDAVSSVISGERVGAAISPAWAVSCNVDYYNNCAGLYYNQEVVGVVTPDGVDFIKSPDVVEPAWSRL